MSRADQERPLRLCDRGESARDGLMLANAERVSQMAEQLCGALRNQGPKSRRSVKLQRLSLPSSQNLRSGCRAQCVGPSAFLLPCLALTRKLVLVSPPPLVPSVQSEESSLLGPPHFWEITHPDQCRHAYEPKCNHEIEQERERSQGTFPSHFGYVPNVPPSSQSRVAGPQTPF